MGGVASIDIGRFGTLTRPCPARDSQVACRRYLGERMDLVSTAQLLENFEKFQASKKAFAS